ncbi:MAG: DUF2079 domain-containing protein [Sandaracinaceae bacterium]
MEAPRQSPQIRRLVVLLALIQGALFATLGLSRYTTVHNETFDLAFYSRIAWGLSHQDFWEPMVNAHIYGLHLSPVLVPLGFVGALTDTAGTLIVAQALALGLATFPIARIGLKHLGSSGALIGAIVWLLYPNLGHVAGYEVHPGAMAALPLAWLAWSLDAQHRRGFVLSVVGVLMCREDLALVTAMAALCFGMRDEGDRKIAAAVGVGSVLYAAFFFLVVHPAYAPEQGSLELHFGPYGRSPVEVVVHLLTHPTTLMAHLGTEARLLYLPKVLAPLLFLPLLRPRWLLPTLPVFAINLISVWPTTTQLDVQYLTPALPFLVAGALDGAERMASRYAMATRILLVLGAAGGHALAGGTPLSLDFPSGAFRSDARTAAALRILDAIPQDASVQAPYAFLPHLAERRYLYRASSLEASADYYILDAAVRRQYLGREDLLRTLEEPVLRDWLARADHAVIRAEGDFLLLERGTHPRAGVGGRALRGAADPEAGQRLTACLSVLGARIEADTLVLSLVATGPCPRDLAVRIGTGQRPSRVDLLCSGLLNPHHMRRGDRVESRHLVSASFAAGLRERGLRVGLLRQSGARPEHEDPVSVAVPLEGAPR